MEGARAKRTFSHGNQRKAKPWKNNKNVDGERTLLTFGGFFEPLKFLSAYALFRKGAPLNAGGADGAGVQMPALLADNVRLVAPDLDLLAALLASYVFRFWRAYLCASGASFFKHD